MRQFSYQRAPSTRDVLANCGDLARPLAGGTDLLPLMKADVMRVPALVDIKASGLPEGVSATKDGFSIGALTTITQIAENVRLARDYALLHDAASLTATHQIRNRATIGGNLLQRPRCAYFRDAATHCWLKGGDTCFAVEGHNEQHAVFGMSPCRAAHPSDLAGCLLALDARVVLTSPRGTREIPISQFFGEPEPERRRETHVACDELLVSVQLPAAGKNSWSVYLKAMDRKTWQFALAGIAVVLGTQAGVVQRLRIVATGVAPVPWRLPDCEQALLGSHGEKKAVDTAIDALAAGARPLSGNSYKIDLAQRLLRTALERAFAKADS